MEVLYLDRTSVPAVIERVTPNVSLEGRAWFVASLSFFWAKGSFFWASGGKHRIQTTRLGLLIGDVKREGQNASTVRVLSCEAEGLMQTLKISDVGTYQALVHVAHIAVRILDLRDELRGLQQPQSNRRLDGSVNMNRPRIDQRYPRLKKWFSATTIRWFERVIRWIGGWLNELVSGSLRAEWRLGKRVWMVVQSFRFNSTDENNYAKRCALYNAWRLSIEGLSLVKKVVKVAKEKAGGTIPGMGKIETWMLENLLEEGEAYRQ